VPPPFTPTRRQELWRSCERCLIGHGPRNIQAELLALAQSAGNEPPDSYGSGGALEELEAELAQLLGKPAALFLPSGTMAQQIALRIHAERARCRTLAFHPTCHLELHEQRGYQRLHGLDAVLVGRRDRLLTRADLDALAEPVAALLLELPQREIGGQLPSWEELSAQCSWARERGVALHVDGARLWESAPFYSRSPRELCALFDTVYVSFYKALGAIAGAALLGEPDFIREARLWQRRHGGNLVSLYPYVLSAREGLRTRLPRVPQYVAQARSIAARLNRLPGVRIVPAPAHTSLFHVHLPRTGERLLDASAAIAEERSLALLTRVRPCDIAGYSVVELSIGDGACALSLDEVEDGFRELLERSGD
jgi:threonine aldolase